MTNLALVSGRRPVTVPPPAQWAHDIRNLLATLGLHLDTLARLSGPHGAKAANAAHALISKVSGMCNEADTVDYRSRRHPFDIAVALRRVVDLVAPLGPEGFVVEMANTGSHFVLADHNEVFRVLFNLLHNAVTVARATGTLLRIGISIERAGEVAVVKISDDGGGLPPQVAARLFRAPAASAAGHGFGLAIARELMERNGGTLTCETSRKGTTFHLELAAFTSIRVAEGPVTRSLGRRASG
jgi:signal transduction histidine kinase